VVTEFRDTMRSLLDRAAVGGVVARALNDGFRAKPVPDAEAPTSSPFSLGFMMSLKLGLRAFDGVTARGLTVDAEATGMVSSSPTEVAANDAAEPDKRLGILVAVVGLPMEPLFDDGGVGIPEFVRLSVLKN
jgi:hypothetical protein